MPTDPLDPEFAVEGPTPKPGQAVQPTNLPAQIRRGQEEALQTGAEISGVMDVRRVLSGETPWTEAVAGAIPMMLGGPEARAEVRAGELGMKELAGRYPRVGPPILRDAKTRKPIEGVTGKKAQAMVDAGTAFWGKQLTPEAEVVQKARQAAQKDITAGNYTPYFKVSERSNVNPTRYPPYKSTVGQLPAKPETIKKYMAMASNPAGVERLQRLRFGRIKQPHHLFIDGAGLRFAKNTSRITGVSPAEVVRRGIVRAEMPLYGAAGVIGVGAAAQQLPGVSDDAGAALGQGAQ